jgi:predicted O-linked N-acetylglucosamine transferase (SPINDLY family)
VQGHYLIYPSTAASEFYDFTIFDHVVTPPEAEPFFRERIYRFSGCYIPLIIPPADLPPTSRAEEGLPEGAVVFVCMNQAYKISSASFMAWCEVLKRVPNSVLWLLAMPPETAFMLRQFMDKQGIDPARMVLAKHVPVPQHQARLALADVGLDALPYCSHTTAIDLVVANVPLVTIEGSTLPGRVAASLLRAGGLPELVQPDASAFVAMATRLAMDARFARDIRQRMFNAFGPEGAAKQLNRQAAEFVALLHRARVDYSIDGVGDHVDGRSHDAGAAI